MSIYEIIEKSRSYAELCDKNILPDPYDDSGFYFIYYAKADYKTVLPEIIDFMDSGLRVYYNRYYDNSNSFLYDYIAKVKSVHCRCAVIYLSEEALKDPLLYRLLKVISDIGCNYLSVNLPVNGEILSGEMLAEKYVAMPDRARLLKELFKNEITYIPGTFTLLKKVEELRRAYRSSSMHYSLCGDFAVADYVFDLQEESVVIPSSVVIGGKEYTVKAVGRGAFANCENLKKIVFPDTVEFIGFLWGEAEALTKRPGEKFEDEDYYDVNATVGANTGTFYRCRSLEEIVFPPHVRRLYQYEFCGCSSLKRLILNDSVEFYSFGQNTDGFFKFNDIYNFTDDDYGNGDDDEETEEDVTEADYKEDEEEIILEELHVSKSVCKLGEYEYKLRLVDAKNGWQDVELCAKKISGYMTIEGKKSYYVDACSFNILYSKHIERIEYDNDWKMSDTICDEYPNCAELTEAVLPDCVENLSGTFAGCVSLTKVKLPKKLRHISDAFDNCASLSHIDLPNELISINGGFRNTALEEIKLPHSVMWITQDTFSGCENLHTVISDSEYNKYLFKHKRNHMDQLITYNHKWWFYFKKIICYLILPLFHPILLIKSIFMRKEIKAAQLRFFEVGCVDKIYIKEGTGNFKIKGYKKVQSDKLGYEKYIK